MAKKKKLNSLSIILKGAGFVLGVLSLIFAFLGCVKYSIGDELITTITGYEAIFGVTKKIMVDTTLSAFSILNLVAFILPVVAGVLLLLKNKLANFLSVLCFVVGAVLLFMVPSFIVCEEIISSFYTMTLAVGSILAAISSILGALVAGYVTFKG